MGKFALLRYLSEFSTKSFVVLITENSKWNHLGAQGKFKPTGEYGRVERRQQPVILSHAQQQVVGVASAHVAPAACAYDVL